MALSRKTSPPESGAKRPSRRLWIAATICACLLGAAALVPVALNLYFTPAKIAAFVEQSLSRATGRKATLAADAHFSVFPWLSLTFGPLTVEDGEEFGQEPMLEIKRGSIKLNPFSLLSRTAEPSDISLEGASLRLKRLADGRTNWSGLPFLADAAAFTPQTENNWRVFPRLRGMRIVDGSLAATDEYSGRSFTLERLNFNTSRGDPMQFSLSCVVSGKTYGVSAEIHAIGSIEYDPETKNFMARDVTAEALAKLPSSIGEGGDGDGAPATPPAPLEALVNAKAAFDSGTGLLVVKEFSAEAPQARLTGHVQISDLFDAPAAEGDLKIEAATARWLSFLGLRQDALDAPKLNEEPDPKDAKLTAAPGAPLKPLVFETSFQASRGRLALVNASLKRGQASLSGEAVYAEKKDEADPELTFALRAADLDLGRLFPGEAGGGAWNPAGMVPKNMRIHGSLDAKGLILNADDKAVIEDLHVSAEAERGHVRLYPVSALLPGGTFNADARGRSEHGVFSFDVTAGLKAFSPVASQDRERVEQPGLSLRARGTADAKGARGALDLAGYDPGGLRGLFRAPERKAGRAALGAFALKADFSLLPGDREFWDKIVLDNGAFTSGALKIGGKAELMNAGRVKTVADLTLERLDAAVLQALPSAASGEDEAAPGAMRLKDAPDLEGRLTVDAFDLYGVAVSGLTVKGAWREGVLDIGEIGGKTFGGALSGTCRADFSGKKETVSLNIQATGTKASLATQALAGAPLAEAAADASLTVDASGETPAELFENLKIKVLVKTPKGGSIASAAGKNGATFSTAQAELTLTPTPGQDAAAKKDAPRFDAKASLTFVSPGILENGRAEAAGQAFFSPDGRLNKLSGANLAVQASLRPAAGKAPGRLSLAGPLTLDPATKTFKADGLSLTLDDVAASASLSFAAAGPGAGLFGTVKAPQFDPRRLFTILSWPLPETVAPDKLRKASFSLSLAVKSGDLSLTDIVLRVDDSTAKGEAFFPGLSPGKGSLRFTVDRLDLDAYDPPSGSTLPSPNEKPYDLKMLRGLDMSMDLSVGTLVKNRIVWGDADINLTARKGRFTLKQTAGAFYGGVFSGQMVGDARDITLKTLLELKIEGFDCAKFLKDWVDGVVLNSGDATFVLAFRSNGLTEAELRQNLGGSFRFQITRGDLLLKDSPPEKPAVPEEPIPHAAVRPDLRPPPPKDELLPFSLLSASFTVRSGVAYTEDFLIDGGKINITGRGAVDLRDESVDLSLAARMDGGAQIPVRISGPLENPQVDIDRSMIVGDMVYRMLRGLLPLPGRALSRTTRPLRDVENLLHF